MNDNLKVESSLINFSTKKNDTNNEQKEKSNKENNKDIKFDTIEMSKIGSLMPKSTEVVDIDDVLVYKENYDSFDRSRLVPYIIYMDLQFRQVVRSRKRSAILWLIAKILFVSLITCCLAYGAFMLLNP